MKIFAATALLLLAIPGLPSVAIAQSTDAPATAAPDTDISRQDGSLSSKLSNSNGVIRPQTDIDPGMGTPAPDTGTTPVIPPAGSPGGSTGIQPK